MLIYVGHRILDPTDPDFRIYVREQLGHNAQYALSIGPRIIKFYGDYFGIPYPLPKLFLAAMENWGLATFRESNLLFDLTSATTSDKEVVALVMAHEMAHQWFGNLVTMKWWNDVRLNEEFATYMQIKSRGTKLGRWRRSF
jgi:aminopeptidase N